MRYVLDRTDTRQGAQIEPLNAPSRHFGAVSDDEMCSLQPGLQLIVTQNDENDKG